MKILHIATECYPAAKAGGMGDVVGALPIYLADHKVEASVILPKYATKWLTAQSFTTVKKDKLKLGSDEYNFRIQKLKKGTLPYHFYVVDIPELYDRENVYLGTDGHGYSDETERYFAFQIAVLKWLNAGRKSYDGLHCHDHMTALIPFMIKYVPEYKKIKDIPTFFTIHNGMYRGVYDWNKVNLLPKYDRKFDGMMDWDGKINSLATALKCAWSVNTVSPSYMKEIAKDRDTLTSLYRNESPKCSGIINGIDDQLWDPAKDNYLNIKLKKGDWTTFKNGNKKALNKEYKLDGKGPLIGFIGRLAHQKGADILASAIKNILAKKEKVNFIILGSGDKSIESSLQELEKTFPGKVATIIAYNEGLARKIYAGSEFLLMPSRFEPCGLNQLYAYRYGNIPVATPVGGLIDTVPDLANDGTGILAKDVDVDAFTKAIQRSITLYKNKKSYIELRDKVSKLDYSWHSSAAEYTKIYKQHIK